MFSFAQINTLELFLILLPLSCSTTSPSANHVVSVFKTFSASNHCSPPPLLPSWSEPPPAFPWITAGASYRPMVYAQHRNHYGLFKQRPAHITPSIKILQCSPMSIRVNRTKSLSTTALPHTHPTYTHFSRILFHCQNYSLPYSLTSSLIICLSLSIQAILNPLLSLENAIILGSF